MSEPPPPVPHSSGNPHKSSALTHQNGSDSSSQVSVSTTSNNSAEFDFNSKPNAYKARMNLELTNYKKQFEIQSKTEVECVKLNIRKEIDFEFRLKTLKQNKTLDSIIQQIDQMEEQNKALETMKQQIAEQLNRQQTPSTLPNTIPHKVPLQHDTTLPPPPPPLQNQAFGYDPNISIIKNSLMGVMETCNQYMLVQSNVLKESLRQSQSTSKEHYLSNAKTCDGKNAKDFDISLEDVMRFVTISGKGLHNVSPYNIKGISPQAHK